MSNMCSYTQKDGAKETLRPNQYLETKKKKLLKDLRETKGTLLYSIES